MTRLRPVLGVVALLLVPMQALAQEVVPYESYRTELAAGLATPDRSNPPLTIDNLIALAEESAARWEAQLAWLGYVIPEPCYADAHAEVLAYLTDSISTLRDAEPLMRAADSAMGAMGILLAAVESLGATHPSAFVQASNTLGGHKADPLHILDTLATCEALSGGPTASPSPSQAPIPSQEVPPPSAAALGRCRDLRRSRFWCEVDRAVGGVGVAADTKTVGAAGPAYTPIVLPVVAVALP